MDRRHIYYIMEASRAERETRSLTRDQLALSAAYRTVLMDHVLRNQRDWNVSQREFYIRSKQFLAITKLLFIVLHREPSTIIYKNNHRVYCRKIDYREALTKTLTRLCERDNDNVRQFGLPYIPSRWVEQVALMHEKRRPILTIRSKPWTPRRTAEGHLETITSLPFPFGRFNFSLEEGEYPSHEEFSSDEEQDLDCTQRAVAAVVATLEAASTVEEVNEDDPQPSTSAQARQEDISNQPSTSRTATTSDRRVQRRRPQNSLPPPCLGLHTACLLNGMSDYQKTYAEGLIHKVLIYGAENRLRSTTELSDIIEE